MSATEWFLGLFIFLSLILAGAVGCLSHTKKYLSFYTNDQRKILLGVHLRIMFNVNILLTSQAVKGITFFFTADRSVDYVLHVLSPSAERICCGVRSQGGNQTSPLHTNPKEPPFDVLIAKDARPSHPHHLGLPAACQDTSFAISQFLSPPPKSSWKTSVEKQNETQ